MRNDYLMLINAEHPLFHPVDRSELVPAFSDYPDILLEPWHFRYVGTPHALRITKRGMALEEYVESLAEEAKRREKVQAFPAGRKERGTANFRFPVRFSLTGRMQTAGKGRI